ncbi:cyclin-dependent kinase-like 2 isoform X2 [Anthonomus grandis grandis]|uniref:cyclin-dependent kinase-like 2 isoform X2 n=1 Tax=Anthonomus grandis grandis TaxID=2921223 RepID=UPI00216519FE|nr:cyclin-dependent kinase-like 2 isoform X2 [Anthonomus grandis grandis]
MEKYDQISVVGEGSYGLVMKCRHKETDQIVAVKKFLETEEDPTIRKLALREIRMLKRLKHENLVTMIEVFRHRKRFYIVFEFLEGTVLDELEKMPAGLGDERTRERIYQVCRAISYCHSNHIIHRDVKPENVLVSSLGVVKLCDFGFARIISLNGEACTEYVATRWYRAPELLVGEPIYGAPVDIWAIGCLFAEMMTGDPLFPGESDIDQLYLIVRMLGKPCSRHQNFMARNTQLRPIIKTPSQESLGFYKVFQTWPLVAIDFLNSCTKMDPNDRLTAEELLKHTYFTHDKFPQRFLPALREKVNMEFNSPLLRKLRSEIIVSTDKREEIKPRKFSTDTKWRFSLTEGTMKRKYTSDTIEQIANENNKNLITLTRSSQRLNVLNNNNNNGSHKGSQQVFSRASPQQKVSAQSKHQQFNTKLSTTNEIQVLEKSLEHLVKINKYDENRPLSDHQKQNSKRGNNTQTTPLAAESPTFHFGIGDHGKSPNIHHILHPSINNISFVKEAPKKSPNTMPNLHNNKTNQASQLGNPRTHFLKKLDRNVVVENIFGQGDHCNNVTANAPHWLNSFGTTNPANHTKKGSKSKNDDFHLPNLPGAAISPSKTKKKNSIPELELPESTEVSPRMASATPHTSPSIKNIIT